MYNERLVSFMTGDFMNVRLFVIFIIGFISSAIPVMRSKKLNTRLYAKRFIILPIGITILMIVFSWKSINFLGLVSMFSAMLSLYFGGRIGIWVFSKRGEE